MTTTTPAPAATPPSPPASEASGALAAALAERLFEGVTAALEIGTIHLGLRLDLYRTLAESGPATSNRVAARAGLDERYVREWLEQQAMAQLLDCVDETAEPLDREYVLPAATAAVLLDPETATYTGPLASLVAGALMTVRDVEAAFRTGSGVAYGAYGSAVRHGLGELNGATFDRELAGWMDALPDIDERLRRSPDARILDLGAGVGRSTLALARAYPNAIVRGIDLDAHSVEDARAAAARAGLADRVTFGAGDAAAAVPDGAAEAGGGGSYDLVTMFETLHDMGDPVGALTAARRQLRQGGALLVADQLTRDAYTADGDPLERFQYGCSVLHCLPATRAERHVLAHGTVIRAATVQDWARQAGFERAQVLPIEDPFWRFYRL